MRPILLATILLATVVAVHGEVPQTINYQGYLADNAGDPVPDGNYNITFTIYPTSSGSSFFWTSGIQTVAVANGQFTYYLGSSVPFPPDLFDEQTRYLGIKVGSDPEITPRVLLASVPYALRAGSTDGGTGWVDTGSRITQENPDDTVVVGDTPFGTWGKLNVRSLATGSAAYLAAENGGVFGSGDIGVSGSGNEYGVRGSSVSGYGGYFFVSGSQPGVYGSNSNYGNFGALGHQRGAVYGATELGDLSYGALAHDTVAVFGKVVYLNEKAVLGKHDVSQNFGFLADTSYGVYGFAANNQSFAIGGQHYDGAYGALGTDDYGLYAHDGGSSSKWAAFLIGQVVVFGNLSKSSGSFQIDHPLDPANKWLYHSFVESPDMMNIYNGNVTTDAEGYATVALPDYFNALNIDFRYQLTVIGTFAQAIISQEITDNRFVIRTDQPNVKVSWQVTGIRNDPYAEKHRIQVEVDKSDAQRGKYAHPELYGLDESRQVGYTGRKK